MAEFRDDSLQTLRRHLFSSEEDLQASGLSKQVVERILNVREMYYYWLRNPQLTDQVLAAQFRERYGYARSNAYILTNYLKILIGDTSRASRAWYQHLFIQRCEEAFAMARANNDSKAFTATLNCLGKYTRLGTEESRLPDYSQIVPQQLEITTDPSVAGFQRIPNLKEKVAKMLNKYAADTNFEVLNKTKQREQNLRTDQVPPPM